MALTDKLAFSRDRNNEDPRRELEEEPARLGNEDGIREMAGNMYNKNLQLEKKDKIELFMTNSGHADFLMLVGLLDADLHERYGEIQKHYDKLNKIDSIDNVVVIYKGGVPAACGAYKRYDADSAELKRIFVRKEFRKQGLAKLVVDRLEELAQKTGYRSLVLETGVKQNEAICLYEKLGYAVIDNYGAYTGDSNSICMRKTL